MQIASYIIVFILVWWTVFFCALPIGNRPSEESDHQLGNAASAPNNPRIGLKIAVTTVLAIFLSGIVIWLINIRLIDWHEKARALDAPTEVSQPVADTSSAAE